MKNYSVRQRHIMDLRFNGKEPNPVSDFRKDQKKILLIEPHKIGAQICENCKKEFSATDWKCPNC